ncbi:DUF4342 domain-containing protein [Thiocystis violascens]|uniref:DUF4342 domain-containing protein n=1 Tax=Thiocystis violascens (strain ATCC 17096 / DSM 198 / 6111) TaxID=765911 RepID=I3Y9V4_THIV6|nr:DUF4342 domain-containing protein [Thiocystis violascens]AFL73772.1 hypothetical protein Thivi_1800 [Thiocystis violascens DSM 198]
MRNDTGRPLSEEITVAGSALVDKVKDLVLKGNVRRLIVRRPNGKVLVDIPLTAGVGVAGVLTLLAPMLTALAAMGALFAQFRIEIERDLNASSEQTDFDRKDRDR